MSEILLVRHAEPALQGVILGSTDSPLSPTGHLQARRLAMRVRNVTPIRALYTSPQRRALQTAAWLLTPWIPLAVIDDLREISYGEWDGLTWEAIAAKDADLARRKANDWLGITVPGAETWLAFSARVQRALAVIQAGPLPAMVVAHQGVNAEIAHQLIGGRQTEFHQDYCEIKRYASHSD